MGGAHCRTKHSKPCREKTKNLRAGQQAFNHRAKCDSAGALGKYSNAMEKELGVA